VLKEGKMSEKIELRNGKQIREWTTRSGYDVVNLDPDAPRFFEPRFTTTAGPMLLFSLEHTFHGLEGAPMVTLKRVLRATTAEDALFLYFREPKERSSGNYEYRVGFALHTKPGETENESIVVAKMPDQ
jgi:hypothetical protein